MRAAATLLAIFLAHALLLAGPDPAVAISVLAVPDSYSVAHDRTLTVAPPGVLANDVGLLGSTASLTGDASRGDLTLRADGGFTYVPDAGFVGTDTWTYRPSGLLTGSTTVTIQVVNTAPVAAHDAYDALTGVQLTVSAPGVLANDTDAQGDSLRVELVDGGGNGSLDLETNGSFTYKSGGSFVGTYSFTYRVHDGVTWSPAATVRIRVGPSATPPPTATPTITPTAAPTPSPSPKPTILPLPSLPLPSLPLPTPHPTTTPRPATTPTSSPTATPTRTPSPSAAMSPWATPEGSPAGGPAAPTTRPGEPSTAAPATATPADERDPDDGLVIGGGSGDPPDVDFGPGLVGFDALVEFAIPSLVLTVPGMLLVIAVLLQGIVGAAWLPFVRRWLGGLGVRRDPHRA
jgi:hypothetical protein